MKHADIVNKVGVAKLAALTGAKPRTVKGWRERGSIPAWFWAPIINEGFATADQLAASAAERVAS